MKENIIFKKERNIVEILLKKMENNRKREMNKNCKQKKNMGRGFDFTSNCSGNRYRKADRFRLIPVEIRDFVTCLVPYILHRGTYNDHSTNQLASVVS